MMNEFYENVVAIERGTMSEDDWLSLCRQSHSWGGSLVMRDVIEAGATEEERPADIPSD